MKYYISICCLLLISGLRAQQATENISKELKFEKVSDKNTLHIANINGSISVMGYEGDKILVEAEKTVSGKTQARLDKGKEEVQVNFIDRADTLIIYVKDGCNTFTLNKKDENGRWGYDWNCNKNNCNVDYDYKVNFTIRIPSQVNLIVSTVNDGDVEVEKVSGVIKANNVNGSIKLTGLKQQAIASTINGDVDIAYNSNPSAECRFYSLNGDINALFQKGLAAMMSFESFNGNFYTNIEGISALPTKVEKTQNKEGVKFKVQGNQYKIGSGGVFLDFETFNGDVYLKEID